MDPVNLKAPYNHGCCIPIPVICRQLVFDCNNPIVIICIGRINPTLQILTVETFQNWLYCDIESKALVSHSFWFQVCLQHGKRIFSKGRVPTYYTCIYSI